MINSFIEANTNGFTHPIPSLLINGKFFRLCWAVVSEYTADELAEESDDETHS